MSFIEDIFDESKNHSALLFEDNQIKIIKLKEKQNNFFPIYWNTMDFNLDNLIDKSKMIDLFKKIQKELNSDEINFDIIFKDKKNIEKQLIDNLKIAGFQKVHPVNWDFNINTLSMTGKEFGRSIFAFSPDNKNLELNYLEAGIIRKKELVKITEINSEKIKYFIKNTDNNHIYISGYFKNSIDTIKDKFYDLGVKVHIFNIWKNILLFQNNIPAIFKEESHEYIKAISLALPPMEEILYEKEDVKPETKNIKKQVEKETEINIDFIRDNKKDTEIISERTTILEKIKYLFNKVVSGPKESESFKYIHEENHILNKKIYLPKPKLKLFLPKPKSLLDNKHSFKLIKRKKKGNEKNKKNKDNLEKEKKIFLKKPSEKTYLPKVDKNIFNKVVFGPKECKSFKYYHDKNHWLNKEINFKTTKK